MPSYPNRGLTNSELIEYLELPEDILTALATAQGSTYTAARNEFLEALYNKVLYSRVESMDFTNPFKKYDSYPVNFGDTIENIFVEVPKGYAFDKDADDPFTKVVPSVKALYASINYELQYQTTIQDALLRRAAINDYGFMNLIDTILASLTKAMSLDEYNATRYMLGNMDIYSETTQITRGSDDTTTAKAITKAIAECVSQMKLPMTANNKLGVLNMSKPENLLLIMKYGIKNSIDFDYLSGVYNLDKVSIIDNIIEVDGFQVARPGEQGAEIEGEDLDFVIIDTSGFDCHVALQDGGMIYNPKGKYTNHFLNLWKIVSFKTFANARAFKLVDGE